MANVADMTEFKKILHDLTMGIVEPEKVDEVLAQIPKATALWLKYSQPVAEGRYHGQQKDGFVFNMHHVAEMENHGVAEGNIEGEHYEVRVKLSAGFLEEMGAQFGLPVKNG